MAMLRMLKPQNQRLTIIQVYYTSFYWELCGKKCRNIHEGLFRKIINNLYTLVIVVLMSYWRVSGGLSWKVHILLQPRSGPQISPGGEQGIWLAVRHTFPGITGTFYYFSYSIMNCYDCYYIYTRRYIAPDTRRNKNTHTKINYKKTQT